MTVTVGERSMHDTGMLIGVSDGLDFLQQHSEINNSCMYILVICQNALSLSVTLTSHRS